MIRNTDAYLLMQFSADIELIRGLLPAHGTPPTAAVQETIKQVGGPVVKGLQSNGHTLADSISMLRAVLYDF